MWVYVPIEVVWLYWLCVGDAYNECMHACERRGGERYYMHSYACNSSLHAGTVTSQLIMHALVEICTHGHGK